MADQVVIESFGNSKFTEDFASENMYRPEHIAEETPQRHSTLVKKSSVSRRSSVKNSGARKSRSDSAASRTGTQETISSPFYTPVPTQTSPTDDLADRFQAWRRVLKDFIMYFREVQAQQEAQSRSILRLSQTLNNTIHPEGFMKSGGLMDTNSFLRTFHREAYLASENAKAIGGEIISHLTGLRGDLGLKIKEIKALSNDFKNSVDKEKEATRKTILQLADSLTAFESDPRSVVGKNEPYLVRLHVEKQLRRQLSEENYLHKAYQNLESSGRELESIVVAEIQKAFENYITIIKQNGQHLSESALKLEQLCLALPHDREWSDYVQHDQSLRGARASLRSIEDIEYAGFHHPGTAEVRSGPLERKSKYLKSYTAGWYVLSATHLHEFKSPDRVSDLSPIMSLYLPECQLGSHTAPDASSHKFILWGRQVGPMHNRHKWTFRAESHETMLQWYQDIEKLIGLSSEERNAYIVAQQRQASSAGEVSREQEMGYGLENDEADEIPYSTSPYIVDTAHKQAQPKRPEGGRFPSDIQLRRGLAESERPQSSGSDLGSAEFVPCAGPASPRNDRTYVVVSKNLTNPTQPRHHSRSSSAFSYDETHPYTQALEREKQEVVPVMAEVPPELERRLSIRHNYETNGEILRQRSDSLTRKPPSRKPTASYGIDPVTGHPDPSAQSELVDQPLDWSELVRENGTNVRSSGSIQAPSRKPTASYGFDPVSGLPDEGVILADNVDRSSASPATLPPAANPTAASTGSAAARPVPSLISLRDVHVPGEYPKHSGAS